MAKGGAGTCPGFRLLGRGSTARVCPEAGSGLSLESPSPLVGGCPAEGMLLGSPGGRLRAVSGPEPLLSRPGLPSLEAPLITVINHGAPKASPAGSYCGSN